jgi:hypothetical protein
MAIRAYGCWIRQACETLPAALADHNQPANLADLPVCQHPGTPPITDTQATPAEKPANLTVLQLQLADQAARSKPVPVDRSQAACGPVIVIRGK